MFRTKQRLEEVALEFRRRVGLSTAVYVDGLTLLQKTKRFYGIGHVSVDDGVLNAEGEFDDVARLIRLPRSVIHASYWADGRARMTIAHEISHAILGHVGILNRSTVRSRAATISKVVAKREAEAKYVAAAILAPLNLVHPSLLPNDIANTFAISAQAAQIRWEDLRELRGYSDQTVRKTPDIFRTLQQKLQSQEQSYNVADSFLDKTCENCGERTILAIGVKFLCTTCDDIT